MSLDIVEPDNEVTLPSEESHKRYLVHAGETVYTVILERSDSHAIRRAESGQFVTRHLWFAVVVSFLILFALPVVQPFDLGTLGLASTLPPLFYMGLTALLVGFTVALTRNPSRSVLGAYVVAVTATLHGLSPLVYEYLRFPWAWKHVGIVEYIQRNGGVDRSAESLSAYHNWPGFFGFDALATDVAGFSSPLSFAHWAPVFFNLMFLAALYVIFQRFTADHRLIATGLVFFTIGNWVGQDYFAPQSVAFLFYLVIVAILLRWFLTSGRSELGAERRIAERPVAGAILLVVIAAVAVTHQLTPAMMIAMLIGLTLIGGLHAKWPLIAALAITGLWLFTFARPFVADYLPRIIADLGNLGGRVDDGLIDYNHVDTSQRYVSLATRGLTAAVLGLAGFGFLRQFRGLGAWRQALVLGATPLLLVVASSYGDEIVFRAYLFVLPIAALFAASLWFPPRSEPPGRIVMASLAAVLIGLSFASLVAMHGNDIQQIFVEDEVAAATLMYNTAPPGSGVIQLTNSYPTKFKNYENLDELDVAAFSLAARERFLSDPSRWFDRWLREGEYVEGYVLITRAQRAEVERQGNLPAGSTDRILDDLRAAKSFEVLFDTPDGVLFRLNKEAIG